MFIVSVFPVFGQMLLREVDLRVNGVGSDTSYEAVVKKFGKPLRSKIEKEKATESCSGGAETHLTLFYSGLEISLLGDGKGRNLKVYSIELSSAKWLASGIPIGASEKEVLEKFGSPNSKEKNNLLGETIFYYVTKGNFGVVNFYFRNGKLSKVLMKETLC